LNLLLIVKNSRCRSHFDLIEPLLRAMVYIRSYNSITTTLDLTAAYIPSKQWKKYIEYKAEYKERLDLLRLEKRETPSLCEGNANLNARRATLTIALTS
jgi:hypothetical protein